jgi:uncharacterized protein (TIGR03435 family)
MKLLTASIAPLLVCLCGYAQSAAPAEFEVASIKPSPPPDGRGMTVGCGGGPGTSDPGLVTCENVNLTMLVTTAYAMSYAQVVAPDWMAQQKFNIQARVPPGTSKEQLPALWQRLLADRFGLAVHREPRVIPKYELLVAKGGNKLKPAGAEPPPADASAPGTPRHPPVKVDRDGFPELIRPGMIGMNGRIRLYQIKMTMDQLAKTIAGQLGRPVDDRTGLTSEYEIRLSWVDPSSGGPETLPGATLPQALQDQLGLRLEATRGPVEFLVVDHMEKLPTGN